MHVKCEAGDICLSCGATQVQLEVTENQTPKSGTDTAKRSHTSTSSADGPSEKDIQHTDLDIERQPKT